MEILILQMRNPKCREIKWLAQDYTSTEFSSQAQASRFQSPDSGTYFTYVPSLLGNILPLLRGSFLPTEVKCPLSFQWPHSVHFLRALILTWNYISIHLLILCLFLPLDYNPSQRQGQIYFICHSTCCTSLLCWRHTECSTNMLKEMETEMQE